METREPQYDAINTFGQEDGLEIEESEGDNPAVIIQEQLKRIHAYEIEKQIQEEGIDYQKIDQFILQITTVDEDNPKVSAISVDDFSVEELKYLLELNIGLGSSLLLAAYSQEDISKIFSRLIGKKENPRFYAFFDYDKNEGREQQNLKTSEAISDVICFQDLTPEEIQKITETVLKDFFQGPPLKDSGAEFSFISRLLSYPPVKQYAEPIIMNYWFMWSDMLQKACEDVNFEDHSSDNIRNIANLLKTCQASYVFLEDHGLLPNEDYSDFMPTFIDRCAQSDDYFLRINARYARYQVAHEALFDYSDENPYEGDAKWRHILINRACDLAFRSEESDDVYEQNREFYDLLGGTIGTLPTVEENGRTFFQYAFAPGFTGLYDQKYNLIKIKRDGKDLNYEGLSSLNQYGQIDNENFYDLIAFQNIALKELVNQDFGVDLSTLPLRVQNQFLNFIKDGDKKLIAGVKEFVLDVSNDAQKISRIKSFFSLEDDPDMASTIFSLEKKFTNISESIFSKYAEIIDATENIREYLTEKFGQKKEMIDSGLINKIIQGMLVKGKKLLVEFENRDDSNNDELIRDLDSYKAEVMLFASTFKALRESGEAPKLEELPVFSIDTVDSGDLTEDQRSHMISTFAENWSRFPEVKDKLLVSFKQALEIPGKKFYLLMYENDIIGFIRFDIISQDELLAASFNVDKNSNGSGLGEAILKNYLTKEAKEHHVSGYAYPKSPIVHRYVGEFGFVVTDIIPNYKGTGEPFFKMERDDRVQSDFKFFNAPNEEVIRAGINEQASDSYFIQTFNTKKQEGMRELESVCLHYLNQGYVITAYREVERGLGQFCVVFEKSSSRFT